MNDFEVDELTDETSLQQPRKRALWAAALILVAGGAAAYLVASRVAHSEPDATPSIAASAISVPASAMEPEPEPEAAVAPAIADKPVDAGIVDAQLPIDGRPPVDASMPPIDAGPVPSVEQPARRHTSARRTRRSDTEPRAGRDPLNDPDALDPEPLDDRAPARDPLDDPDALDPDPFASPAPARSAAPRRDPDALEHPDPPAVAPADDTADPDLYDLR